MTIDARSLFGTDEPIAERRLLRAGPLTAILEDGNLRAISYDGVEAVRAVNYLARDGAWGTYAPNLTDMRVLEADDAFEVSYSGSCAGPEGSFSYKMHIAGEASGRLVMSAEGVATTDFLTNRTGFVVLHPAEAAGGKLEIRHTDGTVEQGTFPQAISPDQPAFDIAAMTHMPAPGLSCMVEMEGDAFETEDQRNWSDASYKTYVRPLSKPRPYTMAKGTRDSQRIAITLSRSGPKSSSSSAVGAKVTIGDPIGKMPKIGLFLEEGFRPTAAIPEAISSQTVMVRCDVAEPDAAQALQPAERFARSIGAALVVEAIFDCRNPQAEARLLADAIGSAGIAPVAVLVSARRDFKTRSSATVPQGEQPIDSVVTALRSEGIRVPIGAGTSSFFTEFNRNPPGQAGDFVFFGVAATVHSADDVSVMETLSVHPAIVESARKLCPGKPVWLGPCTIGLPHNPYGASVADNPAGGRKPMARNDPRQGALFGAAYAVGVAAHAVALGVDQLTLASPAGDFGLLGPDGKPRPILTVHAELASAAGAQAYKVTTGHPGLAALAFENSGRTRVLLANLASKAVEIELPSVPKAVELIGSPESSAEGTHLMLGPYRTVILSLG